MDRAQFDELHATAREAIYARIVEARQHCRDAPRATEQLLFLQQQFRALPTAGAITEPPDQRAEVAALRAELAARDELIAALRAELDAARAATVTP